MKNPKEIKNMSLEEINSELTTARKEFKMICINIKSGINQKNHQKKLYKTYIARLLTFKKQLSK